VIPGHDNGPIHRGGRPPAQAPAWVTQALLDALDRRQSAHETAEAVGTGDVQALTAVDEEPTA
jgi:hypothetical protein